MHISIVASNGANKSVECAKLFGMKEHEIAPKLLAAIRAAAYHVRESDGSLKWVRVNFFDDSDREVTCLSLLNPTDEDIVSWRNHSQPGSYNPWFWQAMWIAVGSPEYGYSVQIDPEKDPVKDLLVIGQYGDRQVAFRKDGSIAFKHKNPKDFDHLVEDYHAYSRRLWEKRGRNRLVELCFQQKDVTTLGFRADTIRREYPVLEVHQYPMNRRDLENRVNASGFYQPSST